MSNVVELAQHELSAVGQRIAAWRSKLQDNLTETNRQTGFAGTRLGVLARLRELERDRKRIARKLIEIDPSRELEYRQHLL